MAGAITAYPNTVIVIFPTDYFYRIIYFQVLIDLGLSRVDNVPQWYKLMPTGEGMNRISDPTLRYRAGTSRLHPVPGNAPLLYPPSRVGQSMAAVSAGSIPHSSTLNKASLLIPNFR